MINLLGMSGLKISLIAVASVIVLIALFTSAYKAYRKHFQRMIVRRSVDLDATPAELVRANLDQADLTEIEVVETRLKTGYNYRTKKIYLGWRMKRPTVYSVSKAMQLVSLAIIMNTEERSRSKVFWANFLNYTTSFFFLFTLIFGLVVALASKNAVVALILIGVGLVLYILGLVVCIKRGSLLKRANKSATELVENMGVFAEDDIKRVKKVYRLEVVEYNLQTLLTIFYIIWFVLKMFEVAAKLSKKRK